MPADRGTFDGPCEQPYQFLSSNTSFLVFPL